MILSVMYTGGSTLVSNVLRKSVRFFIINYFSIIIKTLSKLKLAYQLDLFILLVADYIPCTRQNLKY